jgi:hypothetical protein
MWEQVIASVGGTTTSCEGEWNSGSDNEDGVSQKYWELSERHEKGNIIADGEYSSTLLFCQLALLTESTAHSAVPPRKACQIIPVHGLLLLHAAFGESFHFFKDKDAPNLFASLPLLQW